MEKQEGIITSVDAVESGGKILAFGPFQLLPSRRLLIENGRRVALGGRAFDVLTTLIDRAGTVVSSEELLSLAWSGVTVEEVTLRVHVAALRRALGDGQGGRRFIVNSPGRGYSFVAPVTETSIEAEPVVSTPPADPSDNLPRLLTPVFGRDLAVAAAVTLLQQRRFVTIVGPAGIGKTTVALTVASTLGSSYSDGIRFLDLAPISDPKLVPSALASVLEQPVGSGDPIPALVAVLRHKAILLVIDNCEHVIEIAARLAEEICKGAPNAHVLATSREPLRARGEHIQRLTALEAPPASAEPTAQEALGFPAVQLFVDRCAAALDTFTLSDANAPVIAEICRRLDGIPLALELAAGRIDSFGIRGVAARLDDRFQLLARGHRTAPLRHQALDAAFDWSFHLLSEPAQIVFRRLSIFAGDFDLEAVTKVAGDATLAGPEIAEHLATLVSASLVTAKIATEQASYRLLESTRAYARIKLTADGEFDEVAMRHAEYFRDMLRSAEAGAAHTSSAEWRKVYGHQIENLRVALDWASSSAGDAQLTVDLTVASIPLWTHLSLSEECRSRVEAALELLDREHLQDSREAMYLFAALGNSVAYRFDPRSSMAWTRALEIARALNDTEYQLRAIRGLWTNKFADGNIAEADSLANEFSNIARKSDDPADIPLGQRLTGMVSFYRGDLLNAQQYLESAIAAQAKLETSLHLLRYRLDQQSVTGTMLSKALWLRGFPDQALDMADGILARAVTSEHALTVLDALAYSSCHIAVLACALEDAERHIDELSRQAVSDPQGPWNTFERCWRGTLLSRRGEYPAAVKLLAPALQEMPEGSFLIPHTWFSGELAFALAKVGQVDRAMKVIDGAIKTSRSRDEGWCLPELLRLKGEIILMAGGPGAAEAAAREYQQSLTLAKEQGTLAWELRAATSLARLDTADASQPEATEVLRSIVQRFSEGFATRDLAEALSLINDH